MNTDQIQLVLKHLFKNSRVQFLGVFASDRLPSLPAIRAFSPCCYVANTEQTGWGGAHWVAFFHPTAGKLEFFDSFGKLPKEFGYDIPRSIQIQQNKIQVQGRRSEVCGQLCVYFLYHRSHGTPTQSIIRRLRSLSFSASESLVYSFVQNVLNRIEKA